MPRLKANKRPTWTHLTLEALRVADDFMSLEQLRAATGASMNQQTAALHHLQKVGAVEAVDAGGHPFWFFTGIDRRTFALEERTPEEPGTRRRGPRKPSS